MGDIFPWRHMKFIFAAFFAHQSSFHIPPPKPVQGQPDLKQKPNVVILYSVRSAWNGWRTLRIKANALVCVIRSVLSYPVLTYVSEHSGSSKSVFLCKVSHYQGD